MSATNLNIQWCPAGDAHMKTGGGKSVISTVTPPNAPKKKYVPATAGKCTTCGATKVQNAEGKYYCTPCHKSQSRHTRLLVLSRKRKETYAAPSAAPIIPRQIKLPDRAPWTDKGLQAAIKNALSYAGTARAGGATIFRFRGTSKTLATRLAGHRMASSEAPVCTLTQAGGVWTATAGTDTIDIPEGFYAD